MPVTPANLADSASYAIGTNKEAIFFQHNFASLRGGRTLDTSAFATANPQVLYLMPGHVIIRETATGYYKPMPIVTANSQPYTAIAYDALPSGHTYAGFLINEIPVAKPMAGISINCVINPLASPYTIASIQAAIATANPNIQYNSDNQ